MSSGGQTTCGMGQSQTSGSEKNVRGTESFHSNPSLEKVGLIAAQASGWIPRMYPVLPTPACTRLMI